MIGGSEKDRDRKKRQRDIFHLIFKNIRHTKKEGVSDYLKMTFYLFEFSSLILLLRNALKKYKAIYCAIVHDT